MPEPREPRSIIENAEQAAAAGNYASAEDLLREAAALQEQTLGPHHPDLANTLNNLGVVCEMRDNPIDAEHYFRRAHAIATATLAPDDPFVATSTKNLHDFCAARGRPTELPPSSPAVAAWLEAPAPQVEPRRESSRSAKNAGPDADPSEEILAPARTWRVERCCLTDRDSHAGPPLGQSSRGDRVAAGDHDSSSARDSGPDANSSAGRAARATARHPEAHSAHSERGRGDRRQARYARKTGRDANGGYGAALHRPQRLAMRRCGQPGSAWADVLLHAGQIRHRHHD